MRNRKGCGPVAHEPPLRESSLPETTCFSPVPLRRTLFQRFRTLLDDFNRIRDYGKQASATLQWRQMSIYDERREELEKHEFMMGAERGRLAVTLDLLTDALVLVGQHGVYCQSARQPGKPAMDIQMISKCLVDAKELVSDVMTELKRKSSGE